jgi:multidrug efflux pump
MGFSAPFIARPVATILLSLGLLLSGIVAYRFLPISALPSVDIPTIVVIAARPGADPETMANSVAAPLERRLGEISGVTEITSNSSIGNSSVVVQFDIDRDINGAARDVQAAINAAITDLPSDLPTRPYYRKFNPADAPILTLALSSDTLTTAQIYDAADSILAQRLSQVEGVSQVTVNGAEKPAVRVQLDPVRLAAAGLAGQDVLNAIKGANVLEPTGGFQGPDRAEAIGVNGQISQASDYAPLVLKAGKGAILRLSDVATVINDVANTRLAAWNGKQPAILLTITKAGGANVIDTVDRIKALLPQLMEWLPANINLTVISDRTSTIRASVADVQYTMLMTIALVLLVVLVFMRRLMPTFAAAVTVPLSICGTLAGMWFMGYLLDNFSLMAITISVGFVVDDAIVMIENIVRHRERGVDPMRAALIGSRQIGFTVMSISISLVAVFIPLIFMGGLLGRLFHEFAMTLTMAIAVSAVVSLTLTPMICAHYMRADPTAPPRGRLAARLDRTLERGYAAVHRFYAMTLGWALEHRVFMLLLTLATIVLTVRLYTVLPKGFLPLQDTGILVGSTLASPDVSFTAMEQRQRAVVDVVLKDPAVASVGSTVGVSSGWSSVNRGNLNIALKPLSERRISSEAVIARLRGPLEKVAGVQTTLFSAQDLRGGGRQGGAQFQYALITQDINALRHWALALED